MHCGIILVAQLLVYQKHEGCLNKPSHTLKDRRNPVSTQMLRGLRFVKVSTRRELSHTQSLIFQYRHRPFCSAYNVKSTFVRYLTMVLFSDLPCASGVRRNTIFHGL